MEAGKHPPAWTRFFRRIFRHFLNDDEKRRISKAIGETERATTGEIHVHVVARCPGEPLEAAKKVFQKLGLSKTDGRNGVLILVSHMDHKFAIYGDEGIHAKAGQPLWDKAAKTLREHFAARRYPEGIEACVHEVGKELARHFPKKDGPGKNQLPNEVTGS